MLIADVDRYISLRQKLGFKLERLGRNLRAYAKFVADRGEKHVHVSTAEEWAGKASSPHVRYIRLRDVARLAHFLNAEDPTHEIPADLFRVPVHRRLPYIYTQQEIVRLMEAAGRLRQSHPLRREVYVTMIGLMAATGLRISEVLNLCLEDILADGILQIRKTKFGKSRLLPLHPTAKTALDSYLRCRRGLATTDGHVFLSAGRRRIHATMADYTFSRIRNLAGIALTQSRRPRIHDLRHTFATRVLEKCPTQREAVSRQFVALSTYLGHSDIANTYWYLQATPELLTGIASATETLFTEEAR
jgi:integrase/recombinase XerD